MPEYSVVIPVFNTVESLPILMDGISNVFKEQQKTYEVIFVEDHGSKESWQKLLELKKANPEVVTIIKLARNFGQNGATLCGINQASGEYIITIDDDLQTPPAEILKLIEGMKESSADVVFGKSPSQKVSAVRRAGSKLVKKLFSKVENGSTIGSSFRLMKRSIADSLKVHAHDHLFINQIISWYTVDFVYVDVEHESRSEGKSGYSFFSLFLMTFRIFSYYTNVPLRLVTVSCALGAILSFAMGVWNLINVNKVDVWLYKIFPKGTYSATLFLIALLLGSMSVLALYVNRIYVSRIRKPHYAIQVKL